MEQDLSKSKNLCVHMFTPGVNSTGVWKAEFQVPGESIDPKYSPEQGWVL